MGADVKKVVVAGFLAVLAEASFAEINREVPGCGNLNNAYGPFDYRSDKNRLGIVEQHHFTPEVELLKSGKSGRLGGDLDYTLRAFPNHHRALMSMMKLGVRDKVARASGAAFTVECYMMRAEAFQPSDGVVKVIYGLYLMRTGRTKDAVAKFENARSVADGDPNLHYNLGLAYMDLGEYDKALENAHVAYAAGFPLPGLRDKLKRAGRWREKNGGAASQAKTGEAQQEADVPPNAKAAE